jgi:capsule polysaccharide modification protein KpsS
MMLRRPAGQIFTPPNGVKFMASLHHVNYNRVFAKKHTVTALILYNAEKKYDPTLVV